MKKVILALAAGLAFTFSMAPVINAADYAGNTNSGKFHYTTCRSAQKIRADHRIYFDSRDEAIAAGYIPCKICRP